MLGVDLLKLAREGEGPEFKSDQIPGADALRDEKLAIAAIYEEMKLLPLEDDLKLEGSPTSTDEQISHALIADLLVLVPEVAEYLGQDAETFGKVHALDAKLAQVEHINAGLRDDCAGALLTVAAEATADCDQTLGGAEALLSDPAVALADAVHIDSDLFHATALVVETEQQQKARRQRDALRAERLAEQVAAQKAQVEVRGAVADLRGEGAVPKKHGLTLH